MIDCIIQNGDITLDSRRDIKTTSKVIDSVIRRAATIPTGYSKVVKEGDNQRIVNTTYGTQLAAYLSTTVTGQALVDELMQAASDDGRVDIYDIQYQQGYNAIDVNIAYRDISSDSIQQFSGSI